MKWKKNFIEFVFIILLLILAACDQAVESNWGIQEVKNEELAVDFAQDVVRGGYHVVTSKELKRWIDEKRDLALINTLQKGTASIPGTIGNFAFNTEKDQQLDEEELKRFGKLLGENKDKVLVFYCGFTSCRRSHNGAAWAVKLGYRNVYRCPGGLTAWAQLDYPVVAKNE